jgi:hypothetical protein
VDFWDTEKNVVFIDKNIIREQPNPYKYVPFVCVVCPTGSSLGTKDAIEHQGESLLWANRDLWDKKNEAATILRTITIDSLFGALQYESTHGENMPKPGASPYKPKTIHGVEKGAGYKPIPLADIKNATRLFYSVLEASLQRGSLAAVDYGTLNFPLSSLAITRLTGSRDDIFLPRIEAKARFHQALSRMIIKQCVQLDQKLELGQEGSKNTYTKADLEGDYSIKYTFFTKSKEQDIADLQIANAAQGFLSPDTIRREILKLQDPDGEDAKWKAAQAEKIDEVLFLFNRADSLLEEKSGQKPSITDQFGAKILMERIKTILRQRSAMGQLSPIEGKAQEETKPKSEELLPLLTGKGGGRAKTEGGASEEVANA